MSALQILAAYNEHGENILNEDYVGDLSFRKKMKGNEFRIFREVFKDSLNTTDEMDKVVEELVQYYGSVIEDISKAECLKLALLSIGLWNIHCNHTYQSSYGSFDIVPSNFDDVAAYDEYLKPLLRVGVRFGDIQRRLIKILLEMEILSNSKYEIQLKHGDAVFVINIEEKGMVI